MEDDFDDVGIPDDELTGEADLPEIDGGDEADIDLDVEAVLEPAGRPSGGARARMGSVSREPQAAAAPVRPPAPKVAAKKPAVKKPAPKAKAKAKAKAAKPKARVKAKAKKGAKKKAAPRKKAAHGKGARRTGARKGARKARKGRR